jgi:hypothetical protein
MTEVIKNVKAMNLKTGDRLHNTYGPEEVVMETRWLSGNCKFIKVYTMDSSAVCATDTYPADHYVATIIEEG